MKRFAKNKKGVEILIRTNSSRAMVYINHLGGIHSIVLNKLAFGLWTWAIERNILLRAKHLPGLGNTIADEESRSVRDQCNWSVYTAPTGNVPVGNRHACLTTDTPITTFFSWRLDPIAEVTDTFEQSWREFH